MPRFVMVSTVHGYRQYLNVDHIVSVWRNPKNMSVTYVQMLGVEFPEQIDMELVDFMNEVEVDDDE